MKATIQPDDTNQTSSFIVLSLLFLMWGLITVMTGFLVPEMMNAFELSYYQRIIIALSFFGAYLFISYPAGMLIDKIGFKNGIVTGIVTAAGGCLLFYVASDRISYPLSALSLFMLASGITILQVGANAYVVLVGRRGRGAQRLTFVQAFNALGTVAATLLAGKIITVDPSTLDPESIRTAYAKMVQLPFIGLGMALLVIAVLIYFSKLPKVVTQDVEPLIKEKMPPRKIVWQFPHVVMGCLAIFCYVGAEVSIFQFLLSHKTMAMDNAALVSQIEMMIIVYWGGLMLGRFVGAGLLSLVSPRKLMIVCSLAASTLVLCFVVLVPRELPGDWITPLWIISAIGIFNSVLFPCIYTMGMDGLGKFSEEAASVLIMSIVGGAIIPVVVFDMFTEDPMSVAKAFFVVLAAYLYIVFFGIRGSRYEKRTNLY